MAAPSSSPRPYRTWTVLLPAALVLAPPVGAATPDRLATLQGDLAEIRALMDQSQHQERTLLTQTDRLNLEAQLHRREGEALTIQHRDLQTRLTDTRRQAADRRQDVQAQRTTLARRLRTLYRVGEIDPAKLLLSHEDPADLRDAYRFLSELANRDLTAIQAYRTAVQALEAQEADLARQERRLADLAGRVRTKERALRRSLREKSGLLDTLRGNQEQYRALERELARITSAVDRLAPSGAGTAALNVPSLEKYRGLLTWPAAGRLRTSGALSPTRAKGVEVATDAGAQVSALYFGIVLYARWLKGYGQTLILDHGEHYLSVYAHLDTFLVAEGDEIEKGQAIATAGETGFASGPGVYLELRHSGRPLNLRRWLKGTPPASLQ